MTQEEGVGVNLGTDSKRRNEPLEGYLMKSLKAYEEIIEFIAAGTSPGSVIAFRPSEKAKKRAADLLHKEKTSALSADEKSELDHYMQLEHLLRLAKARARRYVSNA